MTLMPKNTETGKKKEKDVVRWLKTTVGKYCTKEEEDLLTLWLKAVVLSGLSRRSTREVERNLLLGLTRKGKI